MATIGALWINLGINTSSLASGLSNANRALDNFRRQTNAGADNWAKHQLAAINRVNNASFAKLQSELVNLKNAFAAGIVGGGLAEIIRTGMEFERLEFKMIAATGGMQQAANEMAFVRAESDRLGLRVKDAADMFGTIAASAKGTVLQGEGVRNIFTAISEAGTVLRLSSEDVKGALYAVSQMISKGKVSMEELRQQLGERLPGALLIAQRAMNMNGQDFDKMVSKGELYADEFLPKLAKEVRKTFADAVPNAVKSTQSELNRFLTTWDDFLNDMAKGGIIEGFRVLLNVGRESIKGVVWASTTGVAAMYQIWEAFKLDVSMVWETIWLTARKVWEKIVGLIAGGFSVIGSAISKIDAFFGEDSGLGSALTGLADMMKEGTKVNETYAGTWDEIKGRYDEAVKLIDGAVLEKWQDLYGETPPVPDAIAAGTQGSRGGKGKNKEQEKAEKDRLNSIANIIEGLKKEAATYGMTSEQMKIYELQNLKASGSDILAAQAIIAKIEALKQEEARIKKMLEDQDKIIESTTETLKAQQEEFAATMEINDALEQARAKYGDVGGAVEELGDKSVDVFAEMQTAVTGWASDFGKQLTDLFWQADTTFADILESFAKMIQQMLVQKLIVEPLLNGVNAGIGAVGNAVSGFFTNNSSPVTAMPSGGSYSLSGSGGSIGSGFSLTGARTAVGSGAFLDYQMAKGGMINEPVLGIGLNSGSSYSFAERGPEAVVPNGGFGGGGAMNVTVNVINESGTPMQAEQKGGPRFDGEKFVVDVIMKRMATDPSFRTAFNSGR